MLDRLGSCGIRLLPSAADANGQLVVNAQLADPFPVKRVFTVLAPLGALRGQHAHRQCSQFLSAPTGEVVVTVTDGTSVQVHRLSSPTAGLYVPPMVWASEFFATDGAALLVLCDKEYDESDYIRDWEEYLELVLVPDKPRRNRSLSG